MSLTPKQQRFVGEYLVDLNATQAAMRAGYSEATAYSQGQRLLKNVEVAAAVGCRRAELAKKVELTQEMIVAELAKIGFSDIRKAVKWFSQTNIAAVDAIEGEIEDGSIRFAVANQVELISSGDIDDETAAAIAEVSMNAQGGLKVKFHDKQTALVNLGKHLGMFKETVRVEGLAEAIAALSEARGRVVADESSS